MDLLDWYRGRLTSRRLWVLIDHLPRGSAFARAVAGEAAEWDTTDHLLAAVVDQLAVANWMFATVNREPDAEELPFPEPLSRPGTPTAVEPGPHPAATAREIANFFGSR